MDKKHVPERVLKKQERDAKYSKDAQTAQAKAKSERKEKRALYAKNGEKWYHEYQKHDQDLIDSKRKARADGSIFVEPEAKVALVIRTRGILKLDPKSKKILQLLRLRQINNGVFLKINKATINMLRRCEPYVTYGYPNRKTISDIIYKRGHAKVNGERIPLSDNEIVEKELGEFGIVCVEDLIHEIVTCGPHFREANRFLWPFKFSNARGGYDRKSKPYHQGGVWGNRETEINELARRML